MQERFHLTSPLKRLVGNTISEIELVNFFLAPSAKILFGLSAERASSLRLNALSTYESCSPASSAFGPLSALFDNHNEENHFYMIQPAQGNSGRLIIFHHGAFGNFQLYPCLLVEAAKALHATIVSPSRGIGSCDVEEGSALTRETLSLLGEMGLHFEDISLVGLSNGGCTVTGGLSIPEIKNAIFISPVLTGLTNSPATSGKRILFLHGTNDQQISTGYVISEADKLKAKGIAVTTELFEGEDHFLMLAERSEINRRIVQFIQQKGN